MRITFLGDIMLSAEQISAHKQSGHFDFSNLAGSINDAFRKSDYVIANLETPVAGEEYQYTHELYSFNTPAQILETLKEIGVDMIQTANNHCLDRGVEGLIHTMRNMESAGLSYIGTHRQPEDSFRIVQIDGINTGVLAFTYGTNAFANHCYLNSKNRYCVDLLQKQELSGLIERTIYSSQWLPMRIIKRVMEILNPDRFAAPVFERREPDRRERERLRQQILKCRDSGAEWIIMLLHIGGQYNSEPSPYTKELCEYCIKCGANLVVANHEHVIHPYGKMDIPPAGFCWYSLGNFLSSTGVCSEPFDTLSQYSVVLHADINREGSDVNAVYSFQLFLSHQSKDGIIVSEPVWNYLNTCDDRLTKERIQADCSKLLNRIYHTRTLHYDICEYYPVI